VANLTDVLHAIVDLIQENGPGVKADVRRQIDQLGAEALTDIGGRCGKAGDPAEWLMSLKRQ